MTINRVLSAAAVCLLALECVFAQVELSDNPFPDIIARSVVIRPFDLDAPKVTLTGVVTEAPKHIKAPNPYQYFRMAVRDDSAPNGVVIWAVLFWAPDGQTPNLPTGTPVTVRATPPKDGSRRVQLVQEAQGTIQDFVGLQIGKR